MKSSRLSFIALIVFFTASLAIAGGNGQSTPPSGRIVTVKTIADLGAEWWTWAVQAPATDNPLLDPTGEKCEIGQQGSVWFLATTFGSGQPTVRQCDVPAGKALFFPMINAAYFSFLNDPVRTPEFVRSSAEAVCDRSSIRDLSVTIDGRAVGRLERFAVSAEQSPIFQAQLPTDNVFGGDETSIPELLLSPSAHQGFYMYVKALEPGPHTIHWTATWDCNFGVGSEDITYELTVLPGVAGQQ